MSEFSEFLKSYRKNVLHMTQDKASIKAGVSLKGYQNWEYGKRLPEYEYIDNLFGSDFDSKERAYRLRNMEEEKRLRGNQDEITDEVFVTDPEDELQKNTIQSATENICESISPKPNNYEDSNAAYFAPSMKNEILIGTSGSGKSTRVIIPTIKYNATRQNMIILDPMKTLYIDTEKYLKEMGCNVIEYDAEKSVLNFAEKGLHINAEKIAQIIIKNTSSPDDYLDIQELKLLTMLLESDKVSKINDLADSLEHFDENISTSIKSFNTVKASLLARLSSMLNNKKHVNCSWLLSDIREKTNSILFITGGYFTPHTRAMVSLLLNEFLEGFLKENLKYPTKLILDEYGILNNTNLMELVLPRHFNNLTALISIQSINQFERIHHTNWKYLLHSADRVLVLKCTDSESIHEIQELGGKNTIPYAGRGINLRKHKEVYKLTLQDFIFQSPGTLIEISSTKGLRILRLTNSSDNFNPNSTPIETSIETTACLNESCNEATKICIGQGSFAENENTDGICANECFNIYSCQKLKDGTCSGSPSNNN